MTNVTTATGSGSGLQSLASASSGSALGKTSADFNMFLKMLTTQMQNQDPLDPMDTSKYTQQLVQFSQVEQTIQQTGTLKDILSRLSTQDMAQSAGFIGRQVEFDSSVAGLSDTEAAQWSYVATRPVASLTATITDASGKVVDTRAISAATVGQFNWDGTLANGQKAAAGAYTLTLKGADNEGNNVPVAVGSRGIVRDVITDKGAMSFGVNGVYLPASSLVRVASAD